MPCSVIVKAPLKEDCAFETFERNGTRTLSANLRLVDNGTFFDVYTSDLSLLNFLKKMKLSLQPVFFGLRILSWNG